MKIVWILAGLLCWCSGIAHATVQIVGRSDFVALARGAIVAKVDRLIPAGRHDYVLDRGSTTYLFLNTPDIDRDFSEITIVRPTSVFLPYGPLQKLPVVPAGVAAAVQTTIRRAKAGK